MSLFTIFSPQRLDSNVRRLNDAIPKEDLKKQSFSIIKTCHQKEKYTTGRRKIQVRTFEVIRTIFHLYVAIENILIEKICCFALSPLLIGLHWLENNQYVFASNKKKEKSTITMHSDYYSIQHRNFVEQPEMKHDTDWGYFVSFQ